MKSNSTEKKKKVAKSSKTINDDSSSECNSAFETASVASSTSRKRKRNLTGFPSPKKKKKLVSTPVSARAGPPASASKKPVKIKKIIIPKKSTLRKRAELAAKAARKGKAGNKQVQLQLKMGKNGLGLQKPSRSPNKIPPPPAKKAKTSPKSPSPKKVTKRVSRSSLPPKPETEVIDILTSDSDVEDRPIRRNNIKKKTPVKRSPSNSRSKKVLVPKLISDEDKNEVNVEVNDSEASEDTDSSDDNDTSEEDSSDSEADEASDEDRPIRPKSKKAGTRSLRARRKT